MIKQRNALWKGVDFDFDLSQDISKLWNGYLVLFTLTRFRFEAEMAEEVKPLL